MKTKGKKKKKDGEAAESKDKPVPKLSEGAPAAFQLFAVLRLFSAHLPLPPPRAWADDGISVSGVLCSTASCLTALPSGFLLFDMRRGSLRCLSVLVFPALTHPRFATMSHRCQQSA